MDRLGFNSGNSGILERARLRRESGGVEFLICNESGLNIFQIPFWDPGVFFGRISLPSDQERSLGRSSAVV